MIQDLLPWIAFGGGWESRVKAGNIPSGTGGGAIQLNLTLLPGVPTTGGVQNHMPAYFKDNRTGPLQLAETMAYVLNAGESVAIDFLSPPAGCDIHGQNCWSSPDPNTVAYGSVLVEYVADNPAYLRGIAKAQISFLLANAAAGTYTEQITQGEVPAANLWTAPVEVSANQNANSQTKQEASATLGNPGSVTITVRGTLYDQSGSAVTNQDFQIPASGAMGIVFSWDPGQPLGGFGNAMFPLGQDFNGLVSFQVISPQGGAVTAAVYQYVGNTMSSVAMNSKSPLSPGFAPSAATAASCAEFTTAPDGTCTVQHLLPWVVFGGGWESRLKAYNSPSATPSSAVQLRFTLLPAVPVTDGVQNHLPAFYTDTRTGQMQVSESANYTLNAGQSIDIHFQSSPAGCDIHGQHCQGLPNPNTLSFGSMLVQYSSDNPASLRNLADPQLALLAGSPGGSYSWQATEHGVSAAKTWKGPVAISAKQNDNPGIKEEVDAAIANPGQTPVTVRGTLRDPNGTAITYQDFQIPASGAIGIEFSQDPGQPFGGFGNGMFAQGQDFNGWVTFDVTSPNSEGISVVVLQFIGNSVSTVNVQSSQ